MASKDLRDALDETSAEEDSETTEISSTYSHSTRSAKSRAQRSSPRAPQGKENMRANQLPRKLPGRKAPAAKPSAAKPATKVKPKHASNPKQKVATPPRNQPSTSMEPPKQKTAVKNKRKSTAPKKKTGVVHEMIRIQHSTKNQIPLAPFARLVREIMQQCSAQDMRVTSDCLMALRESSEAYITQIFTDSYAITLNRQQVTLAPKDIQLLMFIRGPNAETGRLG